MQHEVLTEELLGSLDGSNVGGSLDDAELMMGSPLCRRADRADLLLGEIPAETALPDLPHRAPEDLGKAHALLTVVLQEPERHALRSPAADALKRLQVLDEIVKQGTEESCHRDLRIPG